jgi:hypothetical protein
MAESFADLSQEMGEARAALRSFTLGAEGFTPQHGIDAISRVNSLCERLQKKFGSGKKASEVASTVAMVRNQIQAAKARLSVLERRKAVAGTRTSKKS